MSSMGHAALVADLKASLLDAAKVFTAPDDADFVRHLNRATGALSRRRPRTMVGHLALVAGQASYPAPADMWFYKSTTWGAGLRCRPWDKAWPGRLPQVRDVGGQLWLMPAPTARQIDVLGAEFTFFYYANHVLSDEAGQTTVSPDERELLLLRAQAEAMRELAMRDSVRNTSVRDGYSGQMRTNSPAVLAQWFLDEFERRSA